MQMELETAYWGGGNFISNGVVGGGHTEKMTLQKDVKKVWEWALFLGEEPPDGGQGGRQIPEQ